VHLVPQSVVVTALIQRLNFRCCLVYVRAYGNGANTSPIYRDQGASKYLLVLILATHYLSHVAKLCVIHIPKSRLTFTTSYCPPHSYSSTSMCIARSLLLTPSYSPESVIAITDLFASFKLWRCAMIQAEYK